MALTEDVQLEIFAAARAGDLDELKTLVDGLEPSDLLKVVNEYTQATPLHYAAANGHDDCVEYLLKVIESNAELQPLVNARNDSGNTPVHWAALNGHLETVKLLCEHQADPLLKNEAGHDAYYEAESNDHEDIVDYLLEKFEILPEDDDEEEEAQPNGN
ncbi:uncharacterized protein SAPINGB_P000113 [Magnusiomyces paraingens]|uniref:Uncharacterized protein n=1 Tax=Magnusiomyces paraingens TaxID=2606893 RepID=A0A5E8AXM6_9ASCO|nr:uncharacterized protein SAPINGB_P000113 [Saprochaete ingens]VVT43716.1 unnamed protein product [Saprochaete ingens]